MHGGASKLAGKSDAFVDTVDAVMITTRHGGLHLAYARPYLEKGIPVWIDKPITTDVEDMKEIIGSGVRGVSAKRTEDGVLAVYQYDDFYVSTYFGTDYTGYGKTEFVNVTLTGCIDAELNEFYHMAKSGQGVTDYKAFAAPVFIIDATIKAFEEGTEVEIIIPEL